MMYNPSMKYQICSRCVMDSSDPDISFDSNNYCNHCNEFFDFKQAIAYKAGESEKKLEDLVSNIKKQGKKNKYDCLIGVSGGVDSSYVAYLVKELGLRPLALHMDNGWNSEHSAANIRNICSKLDIDYISHVLNWDEFKDIQLSILKSSIVEVELPTDIAITAVLHRAAAQHNIKYIIGGGNYATEGILPESWFYNPRDKKLLKSIHKEFGTVPMKTFPTFDFWQEIYYKFFKGIKMAYLLNYFPYSKEEAMNVLTTQFAYQEYGGKHHESVFTRFAQSYIQPVKFNVDYRRATLSSLICNKIVTREQALLELKKPSYDSSTLIADKEYVAKKFNISVDELDSIINAEPQSYKDYPNDERFLNFIYRVYRRFFKPQNNH